MDLVQSASLQGLLESTHQARPRPATNSLVLVLSLCGLGPLSTMLAAVNQIRSDYTSETYVFMVGFLFMSALPVALASTSISRQWEAKHSSRRAFTLRMLGSLSVQALAMMLLVVKSRTLLLMVAAVVGTSSWVAVFTSVSVCGLLPSSAFVWQGFGFHAATIVGLLMAVALKILPRTGWLLVALMPLVGAAAWAALMGDPTIQDLLAAKDESCIRRGTASKLEIPKPAKLLARALMLGVFDSVVVSGLVTFFRGTVSGSSMNVSTAVFLAFHTATIVARPCTLVFDALGLRPTVSRNVWMGLTRLALTPLVFAAAFSSNPPVYPVIVGVFLFSLCGGMFNTWSFVLAQAECENDLDLTVEVSRVLILHQNVGLSCSAGFEGVLGVLVLVINGDSSTGDFFVALFFIFLMVFCLLVLCRLTQQLDDDTSASGDGYSLLLAEGAAANGGHSSVNSSVGGAGDDGDPSTAGSRRHTGFRLLPNLWGASPRMVGRTQADFDEARRHLDETALQEPAEGGVPMTSNPGDHGGSALNGVYTVLV